MSSDEDGAALMAAFKKKPPPGPKANAALSTPRPTPAREASDSPATMSMPDDMDEEFTMHIETPPRKRRAVCVRIPSAKVKKAEYKYYEPQDEVEKILREFAGRKGEMIYEVRLSGDRVKQVSDYILDVSNSLTITGKGSPRARCSWSRYISATSAWIPSSLQPLTRSILLSVYRLPSKSSSSSTVAQRHYKPSNPTTIQTRPVVTTT